VDGGRMGKSEGNAFTLEDLKNKGYDPMIFRYACSLTHYRQKMNFTWEALDGAQNALNRLRETVREWDQPKIGCAEFEQRFIGAINDDVNTPEALSILWQLVDSDYPTSAKAESLLKFDRVLGLRLDTVVGKPIEVPSEVHRLLDSRAQARKQQNWNESDCLRDEILVLGFVIEDTPQGQKVHEKKNVIQ
jgi:cysteinyl-tRNA synthetase